MRVAIVIAELRPETPAARERSLRSASRRAYRRESPPSAQLLEVSARSAAPADLRDAWEASLELVDPAAELIHFTTDRLEPHPGWLRAARAAAYADGYRMVAAPMLWGADGTPPELEARDWAPATASPYPTLTRKQIERFGVPPLAAGCGARFAVRVDYAFTTWPS